MRQPTAACRDAGAPNFARLSEGSTAQESRRGRPRKRPVDDGAVDAASKPLLLPLSQPRHITQPESSVRSVRSSDEGGEEDSNGGGEGGDEGCDEGGSEYTGEEGQIICRNMSVQLQQQASLLVGPSHITAAGWGVFSSASLEKGDFLSECASSDNPCPSTRHRPLAFLPTPNLPMHPPTTATSRFHPASPDVSAPRQVHGRGHFTGGG